jgi:phosphoribosylpyrophosphate synthetase
MEMLLMIDAAKRASARHITAVILVGQDKIEKTSQEFR